MRKPGRPKQPELITMNDALEYIRERMKEKHPLLSSTDISKMVPSKGTLYNWRSEQKLTPYGQPRLALIDRRELDDLCG